MNVFKFAAGTVCLSHLRPHPAWGVSFLSPMSATSFNGEPQAQATPRNDACGLPLNDSENSP